MDILAKKDQVTYAVQCKCHAAKIGNPRREGCVQRKGMLHCMVGAVMTNQVFTDAARRLAEEHNILLWDGAKIEQMVKAAKKKRYAVGEDIASGRILDLGRRRKRDESGSFQGWGGKESAF